MIAIVSHLEAFVTCMLSAQIFSTFPFSIQVGLCRNFYKVFLPPLRNVLLVFIVGASFMAVVGLLYNYILCSIDLPLIFISEFVVKLILYKLV